MPWAKYKIRQQERQGEKLGMLGVPFCPKVSISFGSSSLFWKILPIDFGNCCKPNKSLMVILTRPFPDTGNRGIECFRPGEWNSESSIIEYIFPYYRFTFSPLICLYLYLYPSCTLVSTNLLTG